MKEKNDLYISLLRFGREKLLTGTTLDECLHHLQSIGFFEVPDGHQIENFDRIFNQSFSRSVGTDCVKYFITLEAYFSLIEYEELQEARGSASIAKWTAMLAISLSILSTLTSIFFSFKELKTPVVIANEQLLEIKKAKFDPTFLNGKLFEITENQKNLLKEIHRISTGGKN